ncbi:BrnT family toxin [Phyllobacterium zundukense]|uniref:BrnT family toxin n=1 Tax=Phyllobacterium zundukense TaxID=1867719 RepID=A0A2N9VWW5_9HYPH|nr:BrnT family toxin [Phyllobacterium zundukense]ATU90244.1 hypothetical protein BLM14_00080 [Phyllobacterium zundukense]PIO43983.1 hypothetical protein B5P45_15550 [Phyllobacterium zundukense]
MARFEWDPEKAKSNLRKHGVAFEAIEHFDFETALEWPVNREKVYGEKRIVAISLLRGKVHTLVYALRETSIRVISLRRASRKEAIDYGKSRT